MLRHLLGCALGLLWVGAAAAQPLTVDEDPEPRALALTNPRGLVLGRARELDRGRWALGAAYSLSERPAALRVPSPDPGGRTALIIARRQSLTLTLGAGLPRRWDLELRLPLYLRQDGAGSDALASSQAPPFVRAAPADPALTVGRALLGDASSRLALRAHAELRAPLGDRAALATLGTPSLTPALTAELLLAPCSVQAELGLRWRARRRDAAGQHASTAEPALGVACALWWRLRLGAELWLTLPLYAAPATGPQQVPVASEWLVSLRAHPWRAHPWEPFLAGGTALPLTRAPGASPDAERRSAFGTARLRLVAGLSAQF